MEFALLLVPMVLLMIAGVEMPSAIIAGRDVEALARALADVTSRQSTCPTTAAACGTSSASAITAKTAMTQATVQSIFAAASAIMGQFSVSPLTMTLTAVDVVNNASGNCCAFPVRWTYGQSTNSGNIPLRPCTVNLSAYNGLQPVDTKISDGGYVAPSYTNISNSLNPATTNNVAKATPPTEAIIIADVTYAYQPPFGTSIVGFSPTMRSTRYMFPRTTGQVILSGTIGVPFTATTTQNGTTVYQAGEVCY